MTRQPAPVTALRAPRVFDGFHLHADATIIIAGGRVVDVTQNPPPGAPTEDFPDTLLAPGFIDLQANGGGGALFNDAPTPATLRIIAAAHRRFGTTGIMATLITDARDKIQAAAEAVRTSEEPCVIGLHLEGPFLNPERRGVHAGRFIRIPDEDDLRFLSRETPRPLLVTLAPEMTGAGFVAALAESGIRVSIGHSAASYEQAIQALEAGAGGFTHLFNAMPPLAGRDPGPVGAALAPSARPSVAGIIADGHHVHPANLRLAFAALGAERLALVSDAMPSLGSDQDRFMLQGREIRVADGRLTTEDGTLAGAHLDLASAVRNAVALMGASVEQALRMATRTPADYLGLHDRGRLTPGARADIVALDAALRPVRVWVAGVPC